MLLLQSSVSALHIHNDMAMLHAAGSSFTGNDQDGSPLAANAQPALMTVGHDGMIRIWVEVTLSPSLGAPGSPSR